MHTHTQIGLKNLHDQYQRSRVKASYYTRWCCALPAPLFVGQNQVQKMNIYEIKGAFQNNLLIQSLRGDHLKWTEKSSG